MAGIQFVQDEQFFFRAPTDPTHLPAGVECAGSEILRLLAGRGSPMSGQRTVCDSFVGGHARCHPPDLRFELAQIQAVPAPGPLAKPRSYRKPGPPDRAALQIVRSAIADLSLRLLRPIGESPRCRSSA